MNMLTSVLLLVLAYLFYESGAMFFAFLTILVLFLMFFSSAATTTSPGKAAAAGGASPIVVQGPSMSIPSEIQFQPDWTGPTAGHESIGKRFGEFGGFFVKLFRKIFG
ncbi:hypothetical protein HY991_03720 [Candidatus Micrarchaeota archaeon]|nr:hypothetical protein [Candidatus Micrarchaeota archaeon]